MRQENEPSPLPSPSDCPQPKSSRSGAGISNRSVGKSYTCCLMQKSCQTCKSKQCCMKQGLRYTPALSASPAADLFLSTGDGQIIPGLVSGKSMNKGRKLVATAEEGNKQPLQSGNTEYRIYPSTVIAFLQT